MVDAGEDYRELLKKEQRRRKIRMLRHSIGLTLMAAFLLWLFFYGPRGTTWILLSVVGVLYIIYVLYRLINEVKTFFSLDDELHYEEGEITKFNVRQKKTKKRIPIENVEEVYLNVQDKPNLLFVVYNEDEMKKADSFYKQRIKEREKFMADLEERSLIVDEPVTFEELKEKVEGS
ncbi:MAG: hypothetical protein KGY66_04605 [Candidatus Thermoplasmatota archaeon]|nr:hypothetical protein [Candidatus Thermoplasmatota archaeon]MBS3790178.1 hypothetical protein [Candidatus Thermoplasmatota archaeon]